VTLTALFLHKQRKTCTRIMVPLILKMAGVSFWGNGSTENIECLSAIYGPGKGSLQLIWPWGLQLPEGQFVVKWIFIGK